MTATRHRLDLQFVLIVAFALVFATWEQAAAQRVVPPSRLDLQYSFAPVVRKAAPAVVNVYVRSTTRTRSPRFRDPFFREFFGRGFGRRFGERERVQSSLGSGVIVDRRGLIVTNTHVIRSRGRSDIRVVLNDKREFKAHVVQQDDKTDIAILQITNGRASFPFIDFADSDAVEVGDVVLAIGNPFGVGQTVTSGIVSALARSGLARAQEQVFIQTDAAINPGNSGGALVDMRGRLVGINTAIFSKTGGSHGIGFAIPANLVRLYVNSALDGRKVQKPWLGARLETVSREIAENLGLSRVAGAVVARLDTRGPAAKAGLRAGDVIISVDGRNVADARAALYRLTTRGVGNQVNMTVLRRNRPVDVSLRLVAAPRPGADDVRTLSGNHPLAGARVSNILPSLVDELDLVATEGVVVIDSGRRTTAAALGFKSGDVVVQVGRTKIDNVRALGEALRYDRRVWYLTVQRGERLLRLEVPG